MNTPSKPLADLALFRFDTNLLATDTARLAHQQGLLRAKSEALATTQRLAGLARPLLFGVLAVSFVHLWHQIASIKPAGIEALALHPWFYHGSAGLQTLAVDAVALYLVSTRSVAAYAGDTRRNLAVWFFYVLTALLNLLFVLNYAPALPEWATALVPVLNLVTAVLLALLIPVSIAAVETAHQTVEATRLALLVEVTTLQGIVKTAATSTPETLQHAVTARPMLDTTPALEASPSPLALPASHDASPSTPASSKAASEVASPSYACPHCGASLAKPGLVGLARRYGSCASCKPR